MGCAILIIYIEDGTAQCALQDLERLCGGADLLPEQE